jgi:hypothetical protein
MDCPHRQDPDQCLVCWAEFNVEIEKLRIEAGLTREEFGQVIRDCLAERKTMIVITGKER